MKLSTRGRYGLMALEVLKDAYGQEVVSVASIAEEKKLSSSYLERLFSQLKKAGLVTSIRGPQGGYSLSRPPEEISIGEVLMALEGEMELSCCDGEDSACGLAMPCRTKHVLDRIEAAISDATESISLAEL